MIAEEVVTGTVMRVVEFRPQRWRGDEEKERRDEAVLLSCYLGKVGTVSNLDDRDMPYVLYFSDGCRVPISSMRFHAEEVEAVC